MGADLEFNGIQFEKKLTNLKDSQDSINACCHWCLENRSHHKRIVSTWLNVLKRVRTEQRLTLFYLANDVIQYSKRKNYEFVESWGTALQKATTMVRDDKVKHKILRIFKIWEQRGVYGEEFITDLCGLISVAPVKKTDETHDFQSTYLIQKIRSCAKLEEDTDKKLKVFKQYNPKQYESDVLVSSLKDRAHVEDAEKEVDEFITHLENYANALKSEIKARNHIIGLLVNAETQLEKDRKDVKVVTAAYKSFATRVKNLKKKLEEKASTLNSPVPSPDINAPSPSSDSDIDLPDESTNSTTITTETISFSNPGFYNPVNTTNSIESREDSFVNNGFSSFIGSNFNINNINTSTLFTNNATNEEMLAGNSISTYGNGAIANLFPSIRQPPPPPAPVPPVTSYQGNSQQMPLAPPPLPPFTKNDDSIYCTDVGYNDFNQSYAINNSYNNQSNDNFHLYNNATGDYESNNSSFNTAETNSGGNNFLYDPYNPEDYNPEEEVETWENTGQWDQPPQILETPASPPPVEKEGFLDPIEYHDGQDMMGGLDVDHRVLDVGSRQIKKTEKKQDIDHRNLISLTGSPKSTSASDNSVAWSQTDQDYRIPPPHKEELKPVVTTPQKRDNTESIDMDLSDDEGLIKVSNQVNPEQGSGLLPPPPFPDDVDANELLDSLNEELNYEEEVANHEIVANQHPDWNFQQMHPLPPPHQHNLLTSRSPFQNQINWNEQPPYGTNYSHRDRGNLFNGPPPGDFSRGRFVASGRPFTGKYNRGNHNFMRPTRGRGRSRGRGFNSRGNFRSGYNNY